MTLNNNICPHENITVCRVTLILDFIIETKNSEVNGSLLRYSTNKTLQQRVMR